MDVVGEPQETTTMDGIIPPRITADQLSQKVYSSDQTGAMVYVTAIPDVNYDETNSQTSNVNNPGYYFFDGVQWSEIVDSNKRDGKCVKSTPGSPHFDDNSDMGTQLTVGDFDFRWYWVNGNVGSENSRLEMRKKNSSVTDASVISKTLGGSQMEQATFEDITSDTNWTQVTTGTFRASDQVGEVLLMSDQAQAYRITVGGTRNGISDSSNFCFYVEKLN